MIKFNKGQTLLVVVLLISVSLIVVMSVISRSITDVGISNKEDESLRAFSAAEAGVEKALIAGSGSVTDSLDNSASFTANVNKFSEGTTKFISPVQLLSGESLTVWFVKHNPDGSIDWNCTSGCYNNTALDIYWWDKTPPSDPNQIPAIEVTIYYAPDLSDLSTVKIWRGVYDPDSTRRETNFFEATDTDIVPFAFTLGEPTFKYHKYVTSLPAGLIVAKIKLLYTTSDPVRFGFRSRNISSGVFPSQGITVDSSGAAGESNRKINVFQSYDELPLVFESGIYSSDSISK